MSGYPDDDQFAGLVEAATAAADAHQRDLGKRKRDEDVAYVSVSGDLPSQDGDKSGILSNSAAVLFREPSEKSKKYSRPPLGKVFTSLELAPETFLKLQNAAKDYMLDPKHPERRDVVGHKKHSNNNDVAKLKLWQCVDDFLRMDGNGERFFGQAANVGIPDAPPRTFYWPDDHNRIIKLLMPLLRKMVTNERQRIYAAETRKGDPSKSEKKQKMMDDEGQEDTEMAHDPVMPEIDPTLRNVQTDIDLSTNTNSLPALQEVTLRINFVKSDAGGSQRMLPEIVTSFPELHTYELLMGKIKTTDDGLLDQPSIKAWLPDGLLQIKGQEEWDHAHLTCVMHDWMDRVLRVVVEV